MFEDAAGKHKIKVELPDQPLLAGSGWRASPDPRPDQYRSQQRTPGQTTTHTHTHTHTQINRLLQPELSDYIILVTLFKM